MGPDFYQEEEMKKYTCRCGGETKLTFRTEIAEGVLIKDVPVLACEKCGEEWYPPGVPRMMEGLREAAKSLGRIEILAESQ
jgi:YgiT-type zinc finger domain-containing protein